MMPSAFITGVSGQDGSYLSEYLLGRNYEVYGLVRRTSTQHPWRIEHLLSHDDFELIEGDLSDQSSLNRAVERSEPDEVYNLAAQSFVGTSFDQPVHTGDITGLGAVRVLEAVRDKAPGARFYQASTSEMFGEVQEVPQDEDTPFYPRSPYGIAKLYAHWATINYREAHDIYAVCGILFNHESPRRGKEFVTRKIARGAAAIAAGDRDELRLGNLDAKRDWGHARDYVRAMHAMIQRPEEQAREYVVGTGRTHTVRKCAELAFDEVGLDYEDHVVVDERFYRPAEVHTIQADPARAQTDLDWEPRTTFEELIREMTRIEHERKERNDEFWTKPDTGLLNGETVMETSDDDG
jgi:GDPmannose 4,6-dehydratase